MVAIPFSRIAFGVALLAALAALPLLLDSYLQYILNLILTYSVVGIGLNLLLGYAGQFAFASAALMGIGAYCSALLTYRLGVTYWVALPLSGVVAAVVGTLGVLPAMRMRRVYLALLTVAFAQLVWWTMVHWTSVTLGSDGVNNVAPRFFGAKLRGDREVYYVIAGTTLVLYGAARWILESRIGRAFVAIRENETLARCAGLDVARTKAVVFALSAFYAGVGGGLFALAVGYIEPQSFTLTQMILHFSIVVVGGTASLYGSVIGAVVITALPEALRGLQAVQEIVYGTMLVLFVVFLPQGISGWLIARGVLPREVLSRGWRRLRPPTEARRFLRRPVLSPTQRSDPS